MMALIGRRAFISGTVALIAAPAIVRVESLMPVKAISHLSLNDIARAWLEAFAKAQADLMLYGNGAVQLDGLHARHIPTQEFFNGQ